MYHDPRVVAVSQLWESSQPLITTLVSAADQGKL